MKQFPLLPTIYALAIGLFGIIVLIALTDWRILSANLAPLAFFVALSFLLKRAGFHAAPEVTHSLVGIIDLAAVLIFGPILGAWVAALSGFLYLFLNAMRHGRRTFHALAEIPLFNAGLKIGMAYASTHAYTFFGGTFPPRHVHVEIVLPMTGAVLVWFVIDHIGWALMEFLRGGRRALIDFLRSIFFYSVLVELLPLPFSIVIAVVYAAGETGTFLMIAAGLVGTAIVVQRFADTSRRLEFRSNDLAALNAFGQALSTAAFDTERIVDLLHEHVCRIVKSDVCRIELVEPNRESTTRLALLASREDFQHPNELQNSQYLFDYFTKHREPIRAVDLSRSIVYPPQATETARVAQNLVELQENLAGSALIVPMFANEELIGFLSLFSERAYAYYSIHAHNLTSMCAQAAVAIQNARMFATERKRATQLATISQVSREVASFLGLDELLQSVVTQIRERFGYANVHVFTVDAKEGYVIFRASTHPQSASWRERNVRFRIGLEGIVGWVAATREPLMVPDVRQDQRYLLDPDKALADTRSELAVPLIAGDYVLGVLDVQSYRVNAFDEDDLYVLTTLGAQVAVALEDARLFQSQREEAYFLNVLLQVAENLSVATTLEDALKTIVRITPLLVGVARCALFLYLASEKVFIPGDEYGLTPEEKQAFRQLRIPSDNGLAFDKLAHEQKPLVIEDAATSDLVEIEYLRAFDLRSILMVPLIARGGVVGAIVVDQGSRPTRFTQHEIDVVMGIANQAAAAVESAWLAREAEAKRRLDEEKRRMDYELGLARQIQKSFLPELCPSIPGYEVCSLWESAREISGDFYDFISLPGQRTAMMVADVSDKGMGAALFMALSRTILRTMTIGKATPREAVERANEVILADARSDMFVTVFHATLDPHTHRLVYVNAGHNPPLLYRAAQDQVITLSEHGIALGVLANISLPEHAIQMELGDVLLMYTDGVTDAIDAREQVFGIDRLADVLSANARLSADGLIDAIRHAVTEFSGEGIQFDDVTLIALKRTL